MFDNLRKTASVIVVSIVYSVGLTAMAEGGLVDGIANQAYDAQGEGTSLAGNTGVIDRKDNANQAGSISGSGQAAAAIAGGIMLGAGARMAPSIIIPVSVAGWTLIGMGITELAQSAASGAAKNDNYDQKQLLMREEGDVGKQLTGGSQIPSDVEDMLRNRGLNPDDIWNQARNGQLNTMDDAMRAFGFGNISPEEAAKAKALVANSLSEHTALQPITENLKVDDSVKDKTFGGGESPMGSFAKANLDSDGPATTKTGTEAHSGLGRAPASAEVSVDGEVESNINLKADWSQNILNQFGVKEGTEAEKAAAIEMGLGKLGIQVTKKGKNIFQKASGNYKSYGKWRKTKRVAMQ